MSTEAETVWDKQYRSGEHLRTWPEENLVRWLGSSGLKPGSRVLEVGCGNGRNLWAISEAGFMPHGIDGSRPAIQLAIAMMKARDVRAYQLNAETFPPLEDYYGLLQKQHFDAVVDVQCLQHFDQAGYLAMLQEVRRVLKPDGLFFSMRWAFGEQELIYPAHPELKCGPSDGEWLEADVGELYMRAGLDILKLECCARSYHERTAWATWWLIEARPTR